MIWTDVIEMHEFEGLAWPPPGWHPILRRIDCDRRTAMLERRVELARLESAALRERLDEERLVADAVIRSMHMRIDRDEPIVRLATGLTFHPPGSLAHSQHLLELAALVEERRRHQRAPDSQEETPR